MKGPAIDDFLPGSLTLRSAGDDAGFDVPAAVRAYLAASRGWLRELHAKSDSGRLVNEAHSDLIDRLLRRLFELSEECYFGDGGEGPSELCVVAVGGYARREMSIHSDVDILFLYRDRLTDHVKVVAERVQYWLWDSQVTVGGATRTIGASRSVNASSAATAAISAANPTVRVSSCAISSLPVFRTEAITVSRSHGTTVRRSMTSTRSPNGSAASRERWSISPQLTTVSADPARTTAAAPNGSR